MTPLVETGPIEIQERSSPPQAETGKPVPIEFAGWLPICQQFGHCGGHPQFAHTEKPPPGYRFVRAHEVNNPFLWRPGPEHWWATLGRRIIVFFPALAIFAAKCLWWPLWWPLRALFTWPRNCVRYGPFHFLSTLVAGLRLFLALLRGGSRWVPAAKFVRSRHFTSQLMLPCRPHLLFLTSVPYTYGHYPWVVEIEDATSLFFPFIDNGKTAYRRPEESAYFPILKTLLESGRCRGIISHMRSTAEALPRLFHSEAIANKVAHVPMGVELPAVWQSQEQDQTIHLLFSCSWHQNPQSFFLRGGLEVLEAFAILQEQYSQVRLTLRTPLPVLDDRYHRLIEKNWVRVIHRYLKDDEMDELMRGSHIFLLPAARIHVVSMLKSMAYGQVVVTSDGWGFDEYVEHGHNGLIVPGRLGKASWTDPASGMLREDYRPMFQVDWAVVNGLVAALSALVEDRDLRRRLGLQARHDVATRFNLENWNRGLKKALDRAL